MPLQACIQYHYYYAQFITIIIIMHHSLYIVLRGHWRSRRKTVAHAGCEAG